MVNDHNKQNSKNGNIKKKGKNKIKLNSSKICVPHAFLSYLLGIAQRSIRTNGVFYTLETTVTSTFPGTRMSVVRKGEHAVFIVGKAIFDYIKK